jgi:DNA-directed RNA polymerase subunit RPC12/RpoP
MMSAGDLEIRCPKCNYFVGELRSTAAELKMLCINHRCRSRVLVKVFEGKVTVEAVAREKQAT